MKSVKETHSNVTICISLIDPTANAMFDSRWRPSSHTPHASTCADTGEDDETLFPLASIENVHQCQVIPYCT